MTIDKTAEQFGLRQIELERADARRRGIEEAAKRIEQMDGNELYQKAWKAAAMAVRLLLITEARQ